ncbi:MAG: methylmalonyl-CoA mutase family protein [Wenzhouxiangellaceae bacterium]|nr:methylmalonyl-CoA mutase family protein [Wenzhouxiangellaceae bacterium]
MSQTAQQFQQPVSDAPPLRFVTAASLFDGHDAAINIMRRLIQAEGCEVIHLGHNRAVRDIVDAAIQEDADGIAVSSYQGGHNEFFRYMVDMLGERGASHIRVFGGGGGTIMPDEIRELQEYGVERIYHPDDGMEMGLQAMIGDLVARTRRARELRGSGRSEDDPGLETAAAASDFGVIARNLSAIENGSLSAHELARLQKPNPSASPRFQAPAPAPVVGLTGTGGAGKSSVTDELLNRFLQYFPDMRIAVLAVDPTRRRTGGALLGDRIRINSLRSERVFMRSMATRREHMATSKVLQQCIGYLRTCGFDLVLVETAGIGQADTEIVDLVDFPIYVMTSDYGAASQLEKIDMLDYAEMVILNKFEKRGAEDALRDVRKQWKRNRLAFDLGDDQVPVYPTIASQFNDPGVTWMFAELCRLLRAKFGLDDALWTPALEVGEKQPRAIALIPGQRRRYLAEIAEQGRALNRSVDQQAERASEAQGLYRALAELSDPALPEELVPFDDPESCEGVPETMAAAIAQLRQTYNEKLEALSPESLALLRGWPEKRAGITADEYRYSVRGKEISGSNYRESLSGKRIPKIAAADYRDWGDRLRYLACENLPGEYPYTGGVYPYRRAGEDPTRMFAGEGTPERTNRRFHYLSHGQPTARLSTAFDSVTLYGEDPDPRPDIYGKVGNSGVSIATLDDMKKLYSGFDLCASTTSVSMTINGPAPMILAMFMNTAIDQQVEKYLAEQGRLDEIDKLKAERFVKQEPPRYQGDLPEGNDGLGLKMLGITGDEVLDRETYEKIKADTLKVVRGTVQADILKEDQAQNTCIFSTEFALHMMGDIQQYFIDHEVRNFYSVSISGYHIAEAGANPISQLAFTLANGFTIVEYYLARGMEVDAFAPNLSFFFSNGMDPEYAVIGRVARRIWARAMRERYGANRRSQMLKYHIQTSGRSLHAQEIQFNDIRTTLQALYALFDNCNSLHTNAYDEAITTPTEESVRRAVAIQLIIARELGLNFCENPWSGSFIINELTDLVEEAVYQEFEAISERGGVLGAMDSMYQRGKIQDESLYYESKKHDGSLPIIGVNTFKPGTGEGEEPPAIELIRSSVAEKDQQIEQLNRFRSARNRLGPQSLDQLQAHARRRENTFEALMEAVKYHSLGQISHALYEVGGEYRRNM